MKFPSPKLGSHSTVQKSTHIFFIFANVMTLVFNIASSSEISYLLILESVVKSVKYLRALKISLQSIKREQFSHQNFLRLQEKAEGCGIT